MGWKKPVKRHPYGRGVSPRATWKRFERDVARFFGGKRTPLSGINSQHGTSSDVIWPEGVTNSPKDWLYIEIKRVASYNRAIAPFYDNLHAGLIGIESKPDALDGPQRFLLWFELKWYVAHKEYLKSPFELMETKGFLWKHQYWETKYSPGAKLLFESQEKARKEGKSTTICCFRYHGRQGYVTLIEFQDLARLNAWLTIQYGDGEQNTRALASASRTSERAASFLEERRRLKELRRASLGLTRLSVEESPEGESSKSTGSQEAERQP